MRIGSTDLSLPVVATAIYAVALLVVLVAGASTTGVAFDTHNPDWEGLSEVRDAADPTGVETTVIHEPQDYELVRRGGTVALLVEPGETTPGQRAQLRAFVAGGGTVVVAASTPETANELLRALDTDLRVDGAPLRDERVHGPSPAFPLVQRTAEHPYVADAAGTALNHGTALALAEVEGPEPPESAGTGEHAAPPADHPAWNREGRLRLASTSSFAYLDYDGDGSLGADESLDRRAVVASERVDAGEVVAVSDPSVFINAMQEREPNRALLLGLLDEHDRLVVDRTGEEVPPLIVALQTLRGTPFVAALAILASLLGILTWDRRVTARTRGRARRLGSDVRRTVPAPVRRLLARSALRVAGWAAARGLRLPGTGRFASVDSDGASDRDALLARLHRAHPDLDDHQRDRVLGGIMGVDSEPGEHDRGD